MVRNCAILIIAPWSCIELKRLHLSFINLSRCKSELSFYNIDLLHLASPIHNVSLLLFLIVILRSAYAAWPQMARKKKSLSIFSIDMNEKEIVLKYAVTRLVGPLPNEKTSAHFPNHRNLSTGQMHILEC